MCPRPPAASAGTTRRSASTGRLLTSASSRSEIARGRTSRRLEQAGLLQPLGRPPDDPVGDARAAGDLEQARAAVAQVEDPQQRALVVGRGDRAASGAVE